MQAVLITPNGPDGELATGVSPDYSDYQDNPTRDRVARSMGLCCLWLEYLAREHQIRTTCHL